MPPRLSMDEYVDWIEENLRHCDYARALRQKEIEERILVPFRMHGDPDAAGDRRSAEE